MFIPRISPSKDVGAWTCESKETWESSHDEQASHVDTMSKPCCCGIPMCAKVRSTVEHGLEAKKLGDDDVIALDQLKAIGCPKKVCDHVLARRRTRKGNADLWIARCHWYKDDITNNTVADASGSGWQVNPESKHLTGKPLQRARATWRGHGMAPPIRQLGEFASSPSFMGATGRRRHTLCGTGVAKRTVSPPPTHTPTRACPILHARAHTSKV